MDFNNLLTFFIYTNDIGYFLIIRLNLLLYIFIKNYRILY